MKFIVSQHMFTPSYVGISKLLYKKVFFINLMYFISSSEIIIIPLIITIPDEDQCTRTVFIKI